MIFSLYILNKAGGLVYNRDYTEGLAKLTSNEYLIFAGTFHGIHAITSRISPVPGSSGIQVLESESFKINCFQTQTGIKFLLISDPHHPSCEALLHKCYDVYGDYVMKNPFHTPEMPIRAEQFDAQMLKLIKSVN